MVLADGVLVEQHGVGFLVDLLLAILVLLLLVVLLLAQDFFIVQVHVEEDLVLIVSQ